MLHCFHCRCLVLAAAESPPVLWGSSLGAGSNSVKNTACLLCPWVRRTQTPSAARRRRDGRTCLVYHKPATKHVGGKFVQCTHYMIHTQNTAICKHLNEILVYCTVIAGLQSSNLHISNTSPSVKAQAPPSYQGRRVWFTVLDGVGEPVTCELTRFFP